MLKVVGCFTQEHNFWLVSLAALICLLGVTLTLRLFGRVQSAPRDQKAMQIALTGVMGGATIWTTHFVAMLAYDPVVENTYEPMLTAASLFVAILGVTASLSLAAFRKGSRFVELGGAMLGLSVSAMHYVGMSAYQIPGRIVWDPTLIAVSILLGTTLGAFALNRVVRQCSRYCLLVGVASLTLAICAMHFTGMGAITIEVDPSIPEPTRLLSDAALSVLVVAVMSLLLFVGAAAFMIEAKIEEKAARSFEHATLHDALTGLPNRVNLSHFLDEKAQALEEGELKTLSVLTLDLNRFKEINDTHGHPAGDAILRAIADRLDETLHSGEFIARTGGDEFVAVKTGYVRLSEVRAFAERLAAQFVEPVSFESSDLSIGVSIGIASYPENGSDLSTLLNNSDIAMYRAKNEQCETVCFFDTEMDQRSRTRMELTRDLREALARDEFELHYQLQNDVSTLAPVGFEVLLRWNHPTRGRVSPAEFIPIAEKTGLIRPIGLWVLQTACREAATWTRPFRVAVNVAPQQLVQPAFVERVSDALMESGLDPARLELEITEASIIDDHKNTLEVMHRLKSMGVRIAMDDFGTGYSSLASLRSFPFDKIKIDRSFIDGVHRNEQSAAIVRSTLLLGGALKIPVLAEGVETAEELAFLGAERCAEVQGFLFGKPMAVADARAIACGEEAPSKSEEAA